MAPTLKKHRASTEVSGSNKIHTLTLTTKVRMCKMPWQRVMRVQSREALHYGRSQESIVSRTHMMGLEG